MSITVKVDQDADAAYVRMSNAAVASTTQLSSEVVVDLDEHGMVVGVEMLALDAEIPFTVLVTEYHVRSEQIEIFRRLRPSIAGFLTSTLAEGGRDANARKQPATHQ